jgi:phosphinothricin acetyltransferase
VKVRAALPEDMPGIRAVDEALGQGTGHPDELLRAIEDGRVVVAEEDGALSGYVWWSRVWDVIPLSTLARVHPEYHRRGVGRAMYAHLESELAAAGWKFWLSSTEEDNERSRAFHAAVGFREIGTVAELGQPQREVFLRKDLG